MQHPVWRLFVGASILFIGIDLYFIHTKLQDKIYNVKTAAFSYAVSPAPSNSAVAPNDLCPNSCKTLIKEATSSEQIVKTTQTPIIRAVTQPVQTVTSQVKEFFVPLGTGTSSSDSWTNVPGAQATIDHSQYPGLKSAAFEAAVHVPGHNEGVWVRLFNSTDNYPVGGSELYYENGNSAALLSSGAISLGSGNKVYTVQMKTQLKFPADLTTARIHILTN